MKSMPLLAPLLLLAACATVPPLDPGLIRPWKTELAGEYPTDGPWIARHQNGPYELTYVAARHENEPGSPSIKLVSYLFKNCNFDYLVIEPIPHEAGESPEWFVKEVSADTPGKVIPLGEAGWAVRLAKKHRVPFVGGEPGDAAILAGMKEKGYGELDLLAFYAIRQVPQWRREKQELKGLVERNVPGFLTHNCNKLNVSPCPTLKDVQAWYKKGNGKELTGNLDSEETAPIEGGVFLTQRVSADVNFIRDRFTLALIEKLLGERKRVAVVYGASHYINLRKSFEAALGEAKFYVNGQRQELCTLNPFEVPERGAEE